MAFFQLHRRLFARVSLLLGIGLLLGFAVQAMENPDAKPDRNDPRSKLDGALLRELAHPERGFLRKQVKSGAMAGAILLRLNAAPEPATLAAISGLGIPIIHQSLRWHEIQVEATPAQAVSLAQIPGVSSVRVAWRPFRRASAPVIDQADAVLHTDTLRTTYGATGSGVKMGIISDSLNHTASVGQGTLTGSTLTNTIPQLSGDLPASITVVDGTSTGQGQDTDEGAAMMEEAFKLAPGSGYAFATCGNSDVTMADNITALAGAGCKIICDDIGFLD